jgi:hypothetical protein
MDLPHPHDTRLRLATERRRQELMESLLPEGKAIYETASSTNDKFRANMNALIISMVNAAVMAAVDTAVDRAVERAVDKAVAATVSTAERNMQAHIDGIEEDLRTTMGLTSEDADPDPAARKVGGDAETDPSGHRAATTTRGQGTGVQPYVPPPARGILPNSASSSANHGANSFSSLLHREKRAGSGHHGKPPSMDFPKFSG